MCNQNIIINKFDLNLSTTLSSYYAEYGNKVPEEQNDLNIGVTNATLRKYITLPT
jgi:hypothetical protein